MTIYHNSHAEKYRRPFGAAEISSTVTLGLDAAGAASVTLRLWQEGAGEELVKMSGENGFFTTELTLPDEGCLLWYYFIVQGADGNVYYYGNNAERLGGCGCLYENDPASFQITVYKPAVVSDWYKNAVVYQIFPDRFNRGTDWETRAVSSARLEGWIGPRRVIQQDWDDAPFYSKNEKGEITRWPFFCGTIEGIREKLLYLRSLGITAIYLNPIFRAASNHRYDTADYMTIDPLLGDGESFSALITSARDLGINVILDGVFSHTGADSIYFDKFGNYGGGAYNNEDSPYRSWFRIDKDGGYECWWGSRDLPNTEENDPGFREFICNGVIRHWMDMGVRGWRLDVADELPDSFIRDIRGAVKSADPDGVLIGEVWEDASNKRSYGESRRYLLGDELDAAMNYPFREMMLGFIMGELDSGGLRRQMMSLMENYPRENFYGAFNLIGSHDRARVLTLLGDVPEPLTETQKEHARLSRDEYSLAKRRLKLLSLLQYTSPGVPCVYYGDEAGLEGYADPYNRAPYPWGREDREILYHYRMLSLIYNEHSALRDGKFDILDTKSDVYGFYRENGDECLLVAVNRDDLKPVKQSLKARGAVYALDLLSSKEYPVCDDEITLTLEPLSSVLLLLNKEAPVEPKLNRSAGVICHISSIPSKHKRGTLGADTYKFIDFLADSGMKLWQILPLNPTGKGGSAYLSPAVFAGNPEFIDLDISVSMDAYPDFCESNCYWLDDYAVYSALREYFGGKPWQEWQEDARDRTALGKYTARLAEQIENYKIEQYKFFTQWDAVRAYAASRGITIIGDLPIYVAPDSADTWAHRDEFLLDENGRLTLRAGVPPDYFSPDGQDWGNPLYNWSRMRGNNYEWWEERLKTCVRRYDFVRLDHFRSFASYYAIPDGYSAKEGQWQPGEGMRFFDEMRGRLGNLNIIAEDLGELDEGVYNLIKLSGFPGMNVWQFSEDEIRSMNDAAAANRIFYSGTHDNQTLAGWCADVYPDKNPVRQADGIIEELYASDSPWVIVQLQDMLSLGDEARLNVPGTPEGNWSWRAHAEMLDADTARKYRELAEKYDR